MKDLLICTILDELFDDYYTIWEIMSVIRQKLPIDESKTVDILTDSLKGLLKNNYISIFEGVTFVGDEKLVNIEITSEFILNRCNDWKHKKSNEKDIRLGITEIGRSYYKANCYNTIRSANDNKKP